MDEGSRTEHLRPLTDLSEDRMWGMLESAPDGMMLADSRGTILVVNRQIEVMFGYDRVELLGQPIEVLLPERFRQVHTAHRTRYNAAPNVRAMGADLDLWARRRDGSEFPVEISLSPVVDDQGTAVVASIRDVTDRVAIEAQARLVQTTIDAVHDGVFMFAPDTLQFLYVNDGAIEQTGYGREELLAMTPVHIKPLFTADGFRDTIEPLLAGEVDRLTFSTVHRHRSGTDIPVDIVLEYPPASHPAAERMMVALVRDVSERVQAQARQEAVDARFRSAFGDGPIPMSISEVSPEADRVILEANQALADLLGYPIEQLVGMSFVDITHPDDLAEDDHATSNQTKGTSDLFVGTKRYVRADGRIIWVQIHVAVVSRTEDRIVTIGHVLDITERRAAQQERDRQRALLAGTSELRSLLLADGNVTEALNLLCHHAKQLANVHRVDLAVRRNQDDEVRIWPDVGEPERDIESIALPLSDDLRALLDRTEPFVAEPATNALPVFDGPGPIAVMPLRVGDRLQCLLILHRSADDDDFEPVEIDILGAFSTEAADALAIAELRRSQQKLGLLEDRERIGRDMHDKVIGRLFATGMSIQAAASRLDDRGARDRLHDAVADVDEAIKEIRTVVYGLRSQADWGRGVRGDILALAAEQNAVLGFEPRVRLTGPIDDLDADVVDNLLASLREALTNTAKYAQAKTVTIDVTAGNEVEMVVTDDGVGFDPGAVGVSGTGETSLSSHGVANIASRARSLGGHADFDTAPGSGCRLRWTVPLTPPQ